MQSQLKDQERELKFLKMLLCKGQKNNRELKGVISGKEEEIAELRGRLAVAEHDLSLARKEAQELRDQLQQITKELAEESKNVRDSERIKADLERKRNRFDILLSAFATRTQVWYIQHNYL